VTRHDPAHVRHLTHLAVVTLSWYRRHEQPMRIAMWYGTNGVASMLGSLLAWGLSFSQSKVLYVYQILFLTVGLATVITAPRK
jgi:hypothetical protein